LHAKVVFPAAGRDHFLSSGGTQLSHDKRSKETMPSGNHDTPIFPEAHMPSNE
jgi:hypothetical protein